MQVSGAQRSSVLRGWVYEPSRRRDGLTGVLAAPHLQYARQRDCNASGAQFSGKSRYCFMHSFQRAFQRAPPSPGSQLRYPASTQASIRR
jgi:hypothetical protein